jgi:hypothetical protein
MELGWGTGESFWGTTASTLDLDSQFTHTVRCLIAQIQEKLLHFGLKLGFKRERRWPFLFKDKQKWIRVKAAGLVMFRKRIARRERLSVM